MTTDTLPLTCHHCRTRYRLRTPQAVRPRAKGACGRCGAPFVVVLRAEEQARAEAQSAVSGAGQPVPAASGHDPVRAPGIHRLQFHGVGSSLFGMQLVNTFLTLLTLGAYHFWAKVKIRKYWFSQIEFEGDRFAYHGTGAELLRGFYKASLIFGIPYLLLAVMPEFLDLNPWLKMTSGWLAGVLVLVFVPIAIVSARRYRMSRTSWRGIRLSFAGRAWDFVKLWIKGAILTGLTLGAYFPFFQTQRQDFLVSHTRIGTRSFHFDGEGWHLVPSFALTCMLSLASCAVIYDLAFRRFEWYALLLLPLLLAPLWLWYLARRHRYFWGCTSVGPARFFSTVYWRPLLNLQGQNLVLLVLTLGFAWPWVTVRTTRFYLSNLTLRGPLDPDRILQQPSDAAATGEGLSGFLDTGFDLD